MKYSDFGPVVQEMLYRNIFYQQHWRSSSSVRLIGRGHYKELSYNIILKFRPVVQKMTLKASCYLQL